MFVYHINEVGRFEQTDGKKFVLQQWTLMTPKAERKKKYVCVLYSAVGL